MFEITKSIKRIIGFGSKPDKSQDLPSQENSKEKKSDQKLDKFFGFFGNFVNSLVGEYRVILEKSRDLSATNYNLGLKHLQNGNLKEAIFRFKITKKFWPHNYDAYLQLISCLILNSNFEEAQKVIDELMEKNPSYKEKIDEIFKKYSQEEDYATDNRGVNDEL